MIGDSLHREFKRIYQCYFRINKRDTVRSVYKHQPYISKKQMVFF